MAEMKADRTYSASLDICKFIMSLLVIGIHTEPFGFNLWLDRGFGLVTRLCVPFFFIVSSYFFWRGKRKAREYVARIFILYVVWSVIYLPFDVDALCGMTVPEILHRYFWSGNEHALWFLWASIVGLIITKFLSFFLKPRAILIVAVVFLVFGCMISTWMPAIQKIIPLQSEMFSLIGSRNGLFYAFPYMALGMYVAKCEKPRNNNRLLVGLLASLIGLVIETIFFVILFNASERVLWLSVFPCSYFLFLIVKNLEWNIEREKIKFFRNMSTLIYVSQYLFIPLFARYCKYTLQFLLVSVSTVLFSAFVVRVSRVKHFSWLRYLY